MQICIHHLPSNTHWASKHFPDDQETIDSIHKMMSSLIQKDNQFMNLDTTNGSTIYFSSNILKDCVFTTI